MIDLSFGTQNWRKVRTKERKRKGSNKAALTPRPSHASLVFAYLLRLCGSRCAEGYSNHRSAVTSHRQVVTIPAVRSGADGTERNRTEATERTERTRTPACHQAGQLDELSWRQPSFSPACLETSWAPRKQRHGAGTV